MTPKQGVTLLPNGSCEPPLARGSSKATAIAFQGRNGRCESLTCRSERNREALGSFRRTVSGTEKVTAMLFLRASCDVAVRFKERGSLL